MIVFDKRATRIQAREWSAETVVLRHDIESLCVARLLQMIPITILNDLRGFDV